MTTLRGKEEHWNESRLIKEENVAGGGQFVEGNEHNLRPPIKREHLGTQPTTTQVFINAVILGSPR